MAEHEVELVASQRLSSTVKLLRFRFCGLDSFSYEPGQWLNLRLSQEKSANKRAYSIACMPQGQTPVEVELAVTNVADGVLSSALHAMQRGARAWVDGPHGFFTREGSALHEPALFIGTGSGVAPLRAMLQAAYADAPSAAVPTTLLFGCRSQDDVLFRQEFETLAREQPSFQLCVTLSRPDAAWTGLRGYVQHHVASLIASRPARHVYVCGLSAMTGAVRQELKNLGLGRGVVHTERYD